MQNLIQELKKRNVIRVGVAYIVVAWTIAQVAELALESFEAPLWIMQATLIALLLGLPIAIVLAWIYEITPDGIQKDEDVDRQGSAYIGRGRKFDIALIAMLSIAVAYFIVDKVRHRAITVEADSIAVLPLANRSSDDDSQYFVDGIHDELLTQLGNVSDLAVISRTSVLEYRDSTKKVGEIAEELGVTSLLEGSVRRLGNRVRISVTLIDALQDKQLWSEDYDRELSPTNVFEIQANIAKSIAFALTANLAAADTLPILNRPVTDQQDAYDLYLRAKAIPYDGTADELSTSIELAQRAVELDPDFAVAMGVIGEQYSNLYWFYSQQEKHCAEAKHWIDRALASAPDDPRLYLAQSSVLYQCDLDYEGSLAAAQRAEQGMPSSALAYASMAFALRRSGRVEEAIEAYDKAQILDPRDAVTLAHHIFSFMMIGDVKGARAQADRVKALPHATSIHLGYTKLIDLYLLGEPHSLASFIRERPDVDLGSDQHLIVMLPFFERRYADVLRVLEKEPDPIVAQFNVLTHSAVRARVLHAQGLLDEARAEATIAIDELSALSEAMPGNARPIVTRAAMHAILGNDTETRADVEMALSLYPIEQDAVDAPSYVADSLRAYAMVLDTNELASEMEDYLSLRTKLYYVDYLMLDPAFDRHRGDSSIEALIDRFSLRLPAGEAATAAN